MEHVLYLAALLFLLGLVGVLVRRNVMFLLMSLEVMMNAAGLAFVAAGAKWGQPDGQIMFMFILALAAAEVAVALGLVLQLSRRFETLDVDARTSSAASAGASGVQLPPRSPGAGTPARVPPRGLLAVFGVAPRGTLVACAGAAAAGFSGSLSHRRPAAG